MEDDIYIWTYGGEEASLLNPQPHNVQPEVVAPSLAHVCRWTGHTRSHYSIAQHQVIASYLAVSDLALELCVHDVHEGVTGDISSPMKRMINVLAGWKLIRQIEEKIDLVVEKVYNVRLIPANEEIHYVDLICARLEAIHNVKVPLSKLDKHLGPEPRGMAERLEWLPFTLSEAVRPWPAKEAEERWLHRLDFLRKQRKFKEARQ